MTDKDTKEKMTDFVEKYSLGIVKVVVTILDLILSRCNSFEDFKIGVKQTADNLTKKGEENEQR